jgi:hypothetical protein
VNGTILMRLANAEVLPFEFSNLADTIGRYVEEIEKLTMKGKRPRESIFRLEVGRKLLKPSCGVWDALGRAGKTASAGETGEGAQPIALSVRKKADQ